MISYSRIFSENTDISRAIQSNRIYINRLSPNRRYSRVKKFYTLVKILDRRTIRRDKIISTYSHNYNGKITTYSENIDMKFATYSQNGS